MSTMAATLALYLGYDNRELEDACEIHKHIYFNSHNFWKSTRQLLLSHKSINITNKRAALKMLKDYLRSRPSDDEIESFTNYLSKAWTSIIESFASIKQYVNYIGDEPAGSFCPKKEGGVVFFRPVFLIQFISAISKIAIKSNDSIQAIVTRFSVIETNVSNAPWNKIIWDPVKQTMITRNGTLVSLLLVNMYDSTLLSEKETDSLEKGIQSIFNYDKGDAKKVINSYRYRFCNK